jgi:hypothetical protein
VLHVLYTYLFTNRVCRTTGGESHSLEGPLDTPSPFFNLESYLVLYGYTVSKVGTLCRPLFAPLAICHWPQPPFPAPRLGKTPVRADRRRR